MKILLTNTSLNYRAGSEIWTLTMYNELIKEHEVDVFTVGSNRMIERKYDENKEYDLAIINHRNCLDRLKDNKNIKRKIFTCHGVIPSLEQPIEGSDIYIAVSEETKENMINRGFKCDHIIRNPVNTEQFKCVKPINKELKNILYISNRRESHELIQRACSPYNLTIIGGSRPVSNVEEYINNADLVITIGRGVYESLACNRNVIVYDRGKGDGYIDENSIYKFRQNNCSGRSNKYVWDYKRLQEEFKKYNPELKMREYILRHNNVAKIAHEYINL